MTDASKEGWVAHLEPLSLTVSGLWSHQESHLHINNLERRAFFLAVSHFQSHLRDSCVMVSTDKHSGTGWNTFSLPVSGNQVVSRLEDFLARVYFLSSTTTFLTSYTDVSKES
ncbi:hypothetical protein DPMN_153794 [Dreissena polymorpha]|uniref:Uncharacterized protein n=1 Tax=Dreissena polymorpha TaxID=45954 RepID=A0A9D4J6E3_DREPO|nr:hypothetical protein DPMN_153794 [Dreissena polymorpha]